MDKMESATSETTLTYSSEHTKSSEIISEASSKDSRDNIKIRSSFISSSLFFIKISIWFFGYSVVQGATAAFAIPYQVSILRPEDKTYWNGILPISGMFINLLITPIFGYISDHTKTPFGRRRPYLLVGTMIMIIFLCLEATFDQPYHSIGGFIIVCSGYQLGQGIAGGAFSGIIPDVVHPSQSGIASGWLGVGFSLGLLIGTILFGTLLEVKNVIHTWYLYGATIAFLGISALITICTMHEDSNDEWSFDGSLPSFFKSLHLPSSIYFNFYWVLITRFFNTLGIYMIFSFLLYFATDIIGQTNLMTNSYIIVVLVMCSIPASIAGGYLADFYSTKLLVYISSGIQVVAIALLITISFNPSFAGLLILSGFLGVGYGAYQCVDWALALHSLPNKTIGKDMGIWHISFIAPTVVAPAITGSILQATQITLENGTKISSQYGYAIVFGISSFWFLLATIFIYPMKISAIPKNCSRKDQQQQTNNQQSQNQQQLQPTNNGADLNNHNNGKENPIIEPV
ncbi:hypothetical protein DDB_G0290153 [Dictyostelium discoideum AX4]|uniref:Major facilitator superfamily (MFS) profile domain-containing protein n=1 Tax=Dictyostelium discoideum TaxID=44689 RepID=Q54GH6_DICDI|nr:hypothetical protein DDB_G0290153 [Dictyostelium discoideum AX4]EAL62371.1 hypothetical protein DDB_G0290153 [Dictyostelium discoideum AX4]|eukprot:XP_635875.1 hypothetical protein DDB_G0290153 [Dictyostelium discoideum AX4]